MKVTLFESAVEDLSNSAIDSDFIKGIVELGTTGVKGLDAFIEKFGMLTTLLGAGGIVAGIKNFGGHKILEPHKTIVLKLPNIISVLWDTKVFLWSNVKYTG